MADKKYYWLKLKRDFFKRHDIRIIEEMPNGKEYLLFYLKLLVESIDHEGELRFSDTIPYNEQMLSVITNTNIDVVRSAMKLFVELKMIEVQDDATIYMAEVNKLIGSEWTSAERGKGVDAQKWYDYYSANGWRVGKNPMKDWKAAIRTWERSGDNGRPKPSNFTPYPDEY